MTLFIIKTFEIAADPETAKDQVRHIVVPEKYYEFVKSYWYQWIHDPDLENIFPGNHRMHVIYSMNNSANDCTNDCTGNDINISVGYVITNDSTIELLVVAPEFQGHGLGSKLLDRCLSEIPSKKIRLEVHVLNTGAIRLYRRHGFRFVDSHGQYLVMRYNRLVAKKTANPSKETVNPCQRIKTH